jgi:hypothetical protein
MISNDPFLNVDRIFKGAKPGDLPNLKTAKTIAVKIPQSMLLRADRIIERVREYSPFGCQLLR